MKSRVNTTGKRIIKIVDFQHLQMLRKAIREILSSKDTFQLSILGQLGNDGFFLDKMEVGLERELKTYWNGVLETKTDFGIFGNPEFGTLFVTGPVASQFLKDISGEPLGAISAGPYGILRGMGILEEEVNSHLKLLKEGHYLLFIRTYTQHWKLIKKQLGKLILV